jgi:hypothetical protein
MEKILLIPSAMGVASLASGKNKLNRFHGHQTRNQVPSLETVNAYQDEQRDAHVMLSIDHREGQKCPTWLGRNASVAKGSLGPLAMGVVMDTRAMCQNGEPCRSMEVRWSVVERVDGQSVGCVKTMREEGRTGVSREDAAGIVHCLGSRVGSWMGESMHCREAVELGSARRMVEPPT